MNFSDEDIFFLKNWGTVEKLESSLKNFRRAFAKFLHSVEDMLEQKDWWVDDMVFNKYGEDQIAISRKNWGSDDGNACIWIGVEGFTPESIFGSADPAICYLWLTGERKGEIRDELFRIFENNEEFKEYLAYGGGYVLKKFVRKYTEEEYEDFSSSSCLKDIVDFIEKTYMVIKDYQLPS